MPTRYIGEGIYVARSPPQVYAKDSRRVRRHQFAYAGGIKIVRIGVDITEHWLDALPLQDMGSRDECERGYDDLTAETYSAHQDLQPDRGVADCYTVFDPN